MAKISLSFTYEDLQEYRCVGFETLRKSGHHERVLEDFIATDQRPVGQGLKVFEKGALSVGLLAFRYGYVLPASHNNPKGLSITELEFRRAEALRKPCLVLVVKDTTPWAPRFTAVHMSEDKGQRINTLRQYLNHFNATTGEP